MTRIHTPCEIAGVCVPGKMRRAAARPPVAIVAGLAPGRRWPKGG